jgi:hypothetical protein
MIALRIHRPSLCPTLTQTAHAKSATDATPPDPHFAPSASLA